MRVEPSEDIPAQRPLPDGQPPERTLTLIRKSRPDVWSGHLLIPAFLAVVNLILATFIVATIWIALTTPISCGGCEPYAEVSYGSSIYGGGPSNYTALLTIGGTSFEKTPVLSDFSVNFFRDGSTLSSSHPTLRGSTFIDLGSGVTLFLNDTTGVGSLTGGDSFLISGMTGAHEWRFQLVYQSRQLLGVRSWDTPF